MGIRHADVATSGNKGTAAQWNADHIIDDDSKPKNSTTLIVAAHDSLDTTRADYVCDGIDDDVQIQAAIDALGGQGGRITLLEGSFVLGGTVNLDDNITIEGQGLATLIQWSGAFYGLRCNTKTGIRISSITMVGKGSALAFNIGIQMSQCIDCIIQSCWFYSFGSAGIWVANAGDTIIVSDCFSSGCFGGGMYLTGNGKKVVVSNNDFSDNTGHGLLLTGVTGAVISGNTINNNTASGIYANGIIRCSIMGNICMNNDYNDIGVYDGISLAVNCVGNSLVGNICTDNDRYEINIGAPGCDRNIVVANFLNGSDHTGALNDSGTNTEAGHNVVV